MVLNIAIFTCLYVASFLFGHYVGSRRNRALVKYVEIVVGWLNTGIVIQPGTYMHNRGKRLLDKCK